MTSKHCSKCRQTKYATEAFFKVDRRRKSGFSNPCRQCVNDKWRDRYAHQSEFSAAHKNRVLKDQANNRVASVTRYLRWAKRHPEKTRVVCARRWATLTKATPKWLNARQKSAIKVFYFNAREMTRITGERYTVDHIVPLHNKNVTGLHVPWNLQILSLKENSSKGQHIYVGE